MPVEEHTGGAVHLQGDGGLLTILWLKNVPIVLLTATDPGGNIGRFLVRNGRSIRFGRAGGRAGASRWT